jgi:ABC-type multidrug transport system fused ATPase/permease subunit
MLVVLALFVRLLPRFNTLQQNIHLLAIYVPAFTEAKQLATLAMDAAESNLNPSPVVSAAKMKGQLSIDIVAGGYDGTITLKDIKLLLPEAGVVGIVGESGAGKSTLMNCLLGLADIYKGEVAFGDCEMRSIPISHWRRQIGYVQQDTVLFHQSIRDNIAWGLPSANDQLVQEAAVKALAHDFILQQPAGYATVIGDQGFRLSGGQRQRLGIARALLGQPRLLLMDESTSALDATSEAAVLETIESLRRNICIIIASHRLATVRNADMVVVLSRGVVVEIGAWPALIAKRGHLYQLAQAQGIE